MFGTKPESRDIYSSAINRLKTLVKFLSKEEKAFTRKGNVQEVNAKYMAIKDRKVDINPFPVPDDEEDYDEDQREGMESTQVDDYSAGGVGVYSQRSSTIKNIMMEQLAWRGVVVSRAEKLISWYKLWEGDIEQLRTSIPRYHSMSASDQRTCNTGCSKVFREFHKALDDYGVVRGRVRGKFVTSRETITPISDMISEMAKASGIRINQSGGEMKQQEMAHEFADALVDFCELEVWNSSIETELKNIRGVNKRPIHDYQFAYMSLIDEAHRNDLMKAAGIKNKVGKIIRGNY